MATNAAGIRAGQAYVELGVKDGLAAGLRQAQARVKAFASSLTAVGTAMTQAGGTGLLPFAKGLSVFAEFESNMARVKAILTEKGGLDGGQFAALGKEARRLGATTMFSATDAAKAMAALAGAGFKYTDIMAATEPVLRLAETAQVDLATSARTLMNIMNASNIPAAKLGAAVDVLGSMSVSTIASLEELGDSVKYVGSVARDAGIAFEEAMAAVQLLSNAGMAGDMAGTAIRGVIQSLTNLTPAAAAELKKLGVTVKDAAGNMRPIADIVADLEKLKELGGADRAAVLGKIFPDRQMAAMTLLVSRGAGKLRELTQELRNSGGIAASIAGTQMNTLKGSLDELSSSVENVFISLGKALSPAVRSLAAGLGLAADAVTAWLDRNEGAVTSTASLALACAGLGAGLAAVGLSIKAVLFSFSSFATIGGAVVGLLAAAVSPAGLLTAGLAGLALQFDAVRAAGGAAVARLGETLGWLSGRARETFSAVQDAIANGDIPAALEIVSLSMRLTWLEATQALRLGWIDAMEAVTEGWFFMSMKVEVGMRNLSDFFRLQFGKNLASTWETTTSFLGSAWTSFYGLMAGTLKAIGGMIAWVGGKLAGMLGVSEQVSSFWEGFAHPLSTITAESEATSDISARYANEQAKRKQEFEARRKALDDEVRRLKGELDQKSLFQYGRRNRQGPPEDDTWLGQEFISPAKADEPKVPTTKALLDAGKGAVMGTFNLAGVAGFGVEAALAKVAENTRATADGVKRLVDEVRNGGGWFV